MARESLQGSGPHKTRSPSTRIARGDATGSGASAGSSPRRRPAGRRSVTRRTARDVRKAPVRRAVRDATPPTRPSPPSDDGASTAHCLSRQRAPSRHGAATSTAHPARAAWRACSPAAHGTGRARLRQPGGQPVRVLRPQHLEEVRLVRGPLTLPTHSLACPNTWSPATRRTPSSLTSIIAMGRSSRTTRPNRGRIGRSNGHEEGSLPPRLSLVLELSEEELDALVEEATVDAYNEEEQLGGFSVMIEDTSPSPTSSALNCGSCRAARRLPPPGSSMSTAMAISAAAPRS